MALIFFQERNKMTQFNDLLKKILNPPTQIFKIMIFSRMRGQKICQSYGIIGFICIKCNFNSSVPSSKLKK